jgi:hypothetical protein
MHDTFVEEAAERKPLQLLPHGILLLAPDI